MSTTQQSLAAIFGMDFGTTNSGISVWNYATQKVDVLALDPSHSNPRVARTAIYVTNDQRVHIGRDAVNRYMEQNTGRPVRMEKVWVGEIEVRAEDMFYVTDVYVFADVLSPGRLFLSIKSGLREPDYLGTVVGQHYYPLEDIIALYMTVTKTRAEQQLSDRSIDEIVLGRPVRFAFDPQNDALAQRRLLDSALRAGYKKIHFQYEPVAAAYAYATTVSSPENVLIFDFGGGTLDITIMHIDGKGRHEILSTGGIPVAGDIFDQKMTRAKLPKHFGEGSHYSTDHKNMPVPSWIYDIFSNWQRILELQSPENLEILDEIAQTAHRPREIQALRTLVGDNYGLQMFDAVEQAKRRLSDDMGTLITFTGPNFNVRQLITRTEFESIIGEEVRSIERHLDEMLSQAGLTPDQIDSVVRTGGSAEIPIFRRMLLTKFGPDKVRQIDTFSSVTAGLGICAAHVAEGKLDLKAWTSEDLQAHAVEQETQISPVNLKLLKKRIYLQEGDVDVETLPTRMTVVVGEQNHIQLLAPAA
ncbi:MAG: Hsp70 family protein, partial [Chloroflexota bacterium]